MLKPRHVRFIGAAFALLLGALAVPAAPPAPAKHTDKVSGITFIELKPGTFLMGDPKEGRKVQITEPFSLGETEVTQKQWKAVMGTEPWKGRPMVKEGDNFTATWVSWNDAQDFCKKLSQRTGKTCRLPTNAEWEYACRAGTQTAYSFGDNPARLGDYAWYVDNAYHVNEKYPHEVARKKPNAWGFYDMHGNTWELTSDTVQLKPKQILPPTYKIMRGGAFFGNADSLKMTYTTSTDPASANYTLSFRVAMTSTPTTAPTTTPATAPATPKAPAP